MVMFPVALPDVLFFDPENLFGIAARALHDPIGPTQADHKAFTVIELGEMDNGVLQGLSCFHAMIMHLWL